MSQGKIFISYRRGTDGNAASRLYDLLSSEFGEERIFFDIDTIPMGVDFHKFLEDQVGQCKAFIAVIGPSWIGRVGELADPDDFVRIELEAALGRQGVPVIPVLVDGAKMPASGDLAPGIEGLPRRNGIEISQRYFDLIVREELLPDLQKILIEAEGVDVDDTGEAIDNVADVSPVKIADADRLRSAADDAAAESEGLEGPDPNNDTPAEVKSWAASRKIFYVAALALFGIGFGLSQSGLFGTGGQKDQDNDSSVVTIDGQTLCEADVVASDAVMKRVAAKGPDITAPVMASVSNENLPRGCRLHLVKLLTFMMRDNKDQRKKISAALNTTDLEALLRASVANGRVLRVHASEFLFDLGDPRLMELAIKTWKEQPVENSEGLFQLAMIMTGAASDVSAAKSDQLIAEIKALKGAGQKTELQLSRAISRLR